MKTTIVFVDDESNVLSGLKRGLRGMRKEWDMHFFDQAQDALSYLESSSAQIVVSDMLMPTMNGADFLEIVQEKWPDTYRVILSGELSNELAPRAKKVANTLLSKPMTPKLIQQALEEILEPKVL